MPTGTSDGAKSTRPSRSAVSTRMLPVSAETQSSGPVRLPVSLRARCGTISPTKPSRPAKLTTAAAEALVLGAKIGLGLDTMYEIIRESSGRSFIIENKIPNFIKKRSFEGGFAVDLEYKDLGLAVETAKQLSMPIPMGSTAVQMFEAARAKGFGRQDITSLLKIWEELMDTEVR